MGFFGFVWTLIDGVFNVMYELRHLKRRDKSNRCRVKLILENGDIESYKGMLSNDKRFLYVPGLDRVYIKPNIHREGAWQTVYMPEKTHGKVDFKKLTDIACAQVYRTIIRWPWLRNWHRTDVKIISDKEYAIAYDETIKRDMPFVEVISTGTIDWTVFNDDLSPDFASDAWLLNQSTVLNFLKDMTNWKLMLTILSSLLFGFVLGLIVEVMLPA